MHFRICKSLSRNAAAVGGSLAVAFLVTLQTVAGAATIAGTIDGAATLVAPTCVTAATGQTPSDGVRAETNVTVGISITCTRTTVWNVGLEAVPGFESSVTSGTLKAGKFTMGYGPFSETKKATNAGETVSADSIGGTGTGRPQFLTIHVRIPRSRNVWASASLDPIFATITY